MRRSIEVKNLVDANLDPFQGQFWQWRVENLHPFEGRLCGRAPFDPFETRLFWEVYVGVTNLNPLGRKTWVGGCAYIKVDAFEKILSQGIWDVLKRFLMLVGSHIALCSSKTWQKLKNLAKIANSCLH